MKKVTKKTLLRKVASYLAIAPLNIEIAIFLYKKDEYGNRRECGYIESSKYEGTPYRSHRERSQLMEIIGQIDFSGADVFYKGVGQEHFLKLEYEIISSRFH